MSKRKFLVPVIALLSLSACSSNDVITSKNPSIIDDPVFIEHRLNNPQKSFNNKHEDLKEEYVSSLKHFALDFYSITSRTENSIFSPLSIATCYSMLLEGAKEETKQELEAMLHYDESFDHLNEIKKMLLNTALNDNKYETYLDIAQSVWIDNKYENVIKKDYLDTLEQHYYAEGYKGVLESDEMHEMLAKYINEKTHNFLDVKKDDFKNYGGVLWLLNTIYLKSRWINRFYEESNTTEAFNNLDGSQKDVTYMNARVEGSYYKTDKYIISSFPLNGNLNFSILLPNEGMDYQKVLSDETCISALVEYYNTRNHMGAEMIYKVPQFKIENSYELTDYLPKLGVSKVFDDKLANLTGIAEDTKGNLYVRQSKHEAGIEVKNEGLEAAAYTIIEVAEKSSMATDTMKFIVDHPFTYLINTSDGLPLFMGTINNF